MPKGSVPRYTSLQWATMKWRNGYQLSDQEKKMLEVIYGRRP